MPAPPRPSPGHGTPHPYCQGVLATLGLFVLVEGAPGRGVREQDGTGDSGGSLEVPLGASALSNPDSAPHPAVPRVPSSGRPCGLPLLEEAGPRSLICTVTGPSLGTTSPGSSPPSPSAGFPCPGDGRGHCDWTPRRLPAGLVDTWAFAHFGDLDGAAAILGTRPSHGARLGPRGRTPRRGPRPMAVLLLAL